MYNLVTVHAGHNFNVVGARGSGYKEEVETRRLKDKVIELFRVAGQNVVDTTDDHGGTQQENLRNIVKNCNRYPATGRLDISIHFNQAMSTAGGTEVWYYDQYHVAEKVSAAVATAVGIRDRGPKEGKGLAILKGTNAPAILIEVAFLGNEGNMNAYAHNFDKVAAAIVTSITGKEVMHTIQQYVVTGGLSPQSCEELARYLIDRTWWANLQFPGGGQSPFVTTGGLSEQSLAEFEGWLKDKRWYYEIRQ